MMSNAMFRRVLMGGTGSVLAFLLVRQIRLKGIVGSQSKLPTSPSNSSSSSSSSSRRPHALLGINKRFIDSLRWILKIIFNDSLGCVLLGTQAGLLFSRTIISILVARLDGGLVKALVSRRLGRFMSMLQWWLILALPATTINSWIRSLQFQIAQHARTKLTHYVLERYMHNDTYYKVAQLDSRITNADQLITVDIERFSTTLSELYSNLAKPLLDLILFGTQLATAVGWLAPVIMGSFYIVYGMSLPLITPSFARLAAEKGRLEGEYRAAHGRLITNAEEIAFYKGEVIEKAALMRCYEQLIAHAREIIRQRIGFAIIEGFMLKYATSAIGLLICAIPVFWSTTTTSPLVSIGQRTADYTRNRRYLLSLADAITRILSSTKDIGELAGYTSRVMLLLETLTDINNSIYKKTIPDVNRAVLARFKDGSTEFSNGAIEFVDVPIITPNGDELVTSINMVIESGMHTLITGPNGCGKSSLFRILGGLWPVHEGVLRRPHSCDLFYIPQRPYLSKGNFRDQIIYPDTIDTMQNKGCSDNELFLLLKFVELQYVLTREGGWDTDRDWKDVLSGGEKQRVAMARLFYHKPRFAILDECTSQVSIDVEGLMYRHATDIGITLMTVSHRPSLWKYHSWVCQFDGDGGVEFTRLDVGHRMSLQEEKADIIKKLSDVPHLNQRLDEIALLLGQVPRSSSHLDLQEHIRRAFLPPDTPSTI